MVRGRESRKEIQTLQEKNLDEERKLDPWRTRTRHLISVSSRPLEVGRWHLDSFRISRTVTVRTLRNSISATCDAGGPNFPCLSTGQGKVNVYIELWSGQDGSQKMYGQRRDRTDDLGVISTTL